MKKDEIFFGKYGLTSTSANHISNLAKEFIQQQQTLLDSIKLYDTTVRLISESSSAPYSRGMNEDEFRRIPQVLNEIAEATSLIAWLREALKAKDRLKEECRRYSLEEYCKDNSLEMPVQPEGYEEMSEDEYYGTLSIKERNRYYQLETIASVIGKFIHPNGPFGKARKDLMDKTNNPVSISGNGRDTVLFNYTPSITDNDVVEEVFFELQSQHRNAQAALNSIKFGCEKALQDYEAEQTARYNKEYAEYATAYRELNNMFQEYRLKRTKEIGNLKIIIPDSLKEIYDRISSLGK